MGHSRRTGQPEQDAPRSPGSAPQTLRIWLMGGFRVSVGTRSIEEGEWRLRKAASLVKLLALEPDHRMHRERVMDLLWPDLEPDAATNNLRQALHAARRVLKTKTTPEVASRLLERRGDLLELCPGGVLRVDIEAFEEAARTARKSGEPGAYRAVLDLYAGDLLPEDRYEEWTEGHREALRETYLSLLVDLAALYEEREEIGSAVETLRAVLKEEPTHEGAHVGLMRLYALSGQRQAALRQYERLQEMLRRELGAGFDTESRRFYEDIVAGRLPVAQAPSRHRRSEEPREGPPRHNLPAARTSFVGRERELLEVKRTLEMTRLLTLTGAGGSGKTRLALEVAKELVGVYPDGVWLVELAALSEEGLVPQEVAATLQIREQPHRPLTETLMDTLRPRQMLLILDNCEHLIEACARLADRLIASCPHLRVLATSREPLGVSGEIIWRVPSLSVPHTDRLFDTAELTRYDAVRLFVERARLRQPDFDLTQENASAVAEVSRKLEGMPLAIELATARVGALSVEQIAERLEEPLKLLSAGNRMATARQRTLKGTLEWSHELLSEDERRLFRRLAVFAGSFTLVAAEAICSGDDLEEKEVLDLLSGLVDKSLVAVHERGGEMRYRLLEAVRQYGWEKLEEAGEAEATRQSHANFFVALVQEVAPKVEPRINTTNRLMWLERLEIEHDNLRAVLRWTVETGEAEMGLRLAGALFWFCHMRGYLSEGRGWFKSALTEVPARTVVRAEALYYAAYLGWILGDLLVARSQLEESVAIYREREGHQDGLAHALWLLGLVMLALDEPAVARSLAEESVQIFRTIEGDQFGLSMSLAILGIVLVNQGEHALATSLLEESAAVARKMGDDWFLSLPVRYMGAAAFRRGDYDQAILLLKESLVLLRASGEKWYLSRSLECLAAVDAAQGEHARAARLFGAGEALREAIGASQVPFYLVDYDRGVTAARARLGEEAFAAAWAEGREMTSEQAVEYAVSEEEPAPTRTPTPEEQSVGGQPSPLTAREEEVAVLISQGLSNRQISLELTLSERTVDRHVGKILKKLGFRSRAQIAAWVAEQ